MTTAEFNNIAGQGSRSISALAGIDNDFKRASDILQSAIDYLKENKQSSKEIVTPFTDNIKKHKDNNDAVKSDASTIESEINTIINKCKAQISDPEDGGAGRGH